MDFCRRVVDNAKEVVYKARKHGRLKSDDAIIAPERLHHILQLVIDALSWHLNKECISKLGRVKNKDERRKRGYCVRETEWSRVRRNGGSKLFGYVGRHTRNGEQYRKMCHFSSDAFRWREWSMGMQFKLIQKWAADDEPEFVCCPPLDAILESLGRQRIAFIVPAVVFEFEFLLVKLAHWLARCPPRETDEQFVENLIGTSSNNSTDELLHESTAG